MKLTNYLPAHVLSNSLYELYVGFSSTHEFAPAWAKTRKKAIIDALGEDFWVLLDRITNIRIHLESEANDVVDFDAEFKALDEFTFAMGKRPPGWVSTGATKATFMALNLPTMLLWWLGGAETFNSEFKERDRLSDATITSMYEELKASLPKFGDPGQPWVMLVDSDGDSHAYDKDFIESNVSERCFVENKDDDPLPYYVNGRRVQFSSPMGWVTAYQR